MKKTLLAILCASTSLTALAGGKTDDPILGKVMIGQLETRVTDGDNPLVLEAQGWIGKDLNKLWVKVDAEKVGGEIEEAELQFLYSKAVAPYWDFQVGWRHDIRPKPTKDWLAVGFQGIAPYFFEVDVAAFINKDGQTAFRVAGEYEAMLTQKLVLSPEASFDFHSKDDPTLEIGSGLSSSEVGVRLRYEVTREFAPYIGVNWDRKYGKTANFAKAAGESSNDMQFVVGVRAWF